MVAAAINFDNLFDEGLAEQIQKLGMHASSQGYTFIMSLAKKRGPNTSFFDTHTHFNVDATITSGHNPIEVVMCMLKDMLLNFTQIVYLSKNDEYIATVNKMFEPFAEWHNSQMSPKLIFQDNKWGIQK